MNDQVKVSIIMPVYNAAEYLEEAIDSILRQTYTQFEFIIINDGSTDSSRLIVLSYRDSRIRLIDNNTNLGLPASLNKGIKFAKGNYIARQDADDVSLPERLAEQVRCLEEDNTIGVVGCWWENIDIKGRVFSSETAPNDSEVLLQRLLVQGLNPSCHGSVMMRQGLVKRVGGYDERILHSEDFDLWLRLWPLTKFYIINRFLYRYRVVPEYSRFKSLCQTKYFEIAVEQFKSRRRIEFEDVRVDILRTYPDAKEIILKPLVKYYVSLAYIAWLNHKRRLAIFYFAEAVKEGGTKTIFMLVKYGVRLLRGEYAKR